MKIKVRTLAKTFKSTSITKVKNSEQLNIIVKALGEIYKVKAHGVTDKIGDNQVTYYVATEDKIGKNLKEIEAFCEGIKYMMK